MFGYLVLLLLPALVVSSNEHIAETIPDSLTDPKRCHAKKGYVCDVDRLLPNYNGTSGTEVLNDAIAEVLKNPVCLCNTTCIHNNTVISVVVIEKLKMAENETDQNKVLEAMKKFADDVRSRQKRWNCDDDILIVLSVGQKALRSSYGNPIAGKMSEKLDKIILSNQEDDFEKKEWTRGLLRIIENYGRALRGEKIIENKKKHWYDPLPLWAVIAIGSFIGLLLILAVVGVVLCVCRKSQGYTMGHRT